MARQPPSSPSPPADPGWEYEHEEDAGRPGNETAVPSEGEQGNATRAPAHGALQQRCGLVAPRRVRRPLRVRPFDQRAQRECVGLRPSVEQA